MEAAFVARFEIMEWASGLTRCCWYQWDNSGDGTLRSATRINRCSTTFTSGHVCKPGTAYQQVYDWLVVSTLGACSVSGTTWTCRLTQSTSEEQRFSVHLETNALFAGRQIPVLFQSSRWRVQCGGPRRYGSPGTTHSHRLTICRPETMSEPPDFRLRMKPPAAFLPLGRRHRFSTVDRHTWLDAMRSDNCRKDQRIELTELLEHFVRTNSQGVGPN